MRAVTARDVKEVEEVMARMKGFVKRSREGATE